MSRRPRLQLAGWLRRTPAEFRYFSLVLLGGVVFFGGCNPRKYYIREENVADDYRVATQIAYPDVHESSSEAVTESLSPRTVRDPAQTELWDLKLQEVVQIALGNSEVMRDLGGRVIRGPEATPTIYDAALRESDPRVGVEGALAAFDANLSAGITWSRDDLPLNNGIIVGQFQQAPSAFILQRDLSNFAAELNKVTAVGSEVFVRHTVDYRFTNVPSNLFSSAYDSAIEFGVRQPLLQGAGVEFNRIAGPQATPGLFFSNGVLIARTNTDIALAEFEAAVRDFVSELEDTYWELYFAYRDLDAQVTARDSSLETWRVVKAKYDEGARGGSLGEEAQAREQYFAFRARVEAALGGSGLRSDSQGGLYGTEAKLRQLMGLPVNDGRLIRPIDEPTSAPIVFDWSAVLRESLTRRVELRQQKWRIKQRELQLVAAKNFLLPRLDFAALYRVNGFGDKLIASDSDNARFQNAAETLTGGDFADWQLGLQLDVPIGFRRAWAAVRNAELRLMRERAVLRDQELQVSHHLGQALRNLDAAYSQTQSHYNRLRATEDRVRSEQSRYEEGVITLDLLLEAQELRARAESDYFRSLLNYQQALKQVQFEKGTLLAMNNVYLTEGPWPDQASDDAFQRARERANARHIHVGATQPPPFVEASFETTEGLDASHATDPKMLKHSMRPVPTETSPSPSENPAVLTLPEIQDSK